MVCVYKFDHNLENVDFETAPTDRFRRKRTSGYTLSTTNRRDFYAVMASTDDILEATQSYTITLSSTNANVDSNRASLTINILDTNNGTLSITSLSVNCTLEIVQDRN